MVSKPIVLTLLVLALTGCDTLYSDGQRTGVVQKISNKGLIWRTWEGELVLDGIRMRVDKDGGGMTNIWNFSTMDEAVAVKLQAAAADKKVVTLTYEEVIFPSPSKSATGYRVTAVEGL